MLFYFFAFEAYLYTSTNAHEAYAASMPASRMACYQQLQPCICRAQRTPW